MRLKDKRLVKLENRFKETKDIKLVWELLDEKGKKVGTLKGLTKEEHDELIKNNSWSLL